MNRRVGVAPGFALAVGSVPFGSTLAVAGEVEVQVLIGDPRAAGGGAVESDRAVVYKFDETSRVMKQVLTFNDHSPQSDAKFGSTDNALKFCSASSISSTTPCPQGDTAHGSMASGNDEAFVDYQAGDKIRVRMRDGNMVRDVRAP